MNCQNQSTTDAGHSELLLAAQFAYEYLSLKVSVADEDYGVVTGLAAAISNVLEGKALPAEPDAVLEKSKALAASGDRVGALKHYRAGKGCSLEEARDAICPGEGTRAAPPAVDARDTALLDAIEHERIAVIPEFEGPWDAQIFGEDEAPLACGSGTTPRKAIAEALASLEARKARAGLAAKESP